MCGKYVQSLGLIFDVIGVVIIANGMRKQNYQESSPFGIPVNTAEMLSHLGNSPLFGTWFLIAGFVLQFIAL